MKREYTSKKVNVLGIDVSVMRPEKAMNLSMNYMRSKGMEVVFFLSAESSLFCQSYPWASELIRSCPLVLVGDDHTENAVFHREEDDGKDAGDGGKNAQSLGTYADEYLKKLFAKLNKEQRGIYAVMEKQEYMESLEKYMKTSYPNIYFNGIVYEGETEGEPDKVVNEINANIPDIVFFCLPVEHQLTFMKDYASMMNTGLCICIESLQALIHKEIGNVPPLIHFFHMDSIWFYMKREALIRKTIVGSIFKKRMGDYNQKR